MSVSRGDVLWATAPYSSSSSRPWLVANNDTHPFDDEEVICLLLTTTARDIAIEITDEAIVDGGFPTRSYINPWVPVTMKRSALGDLQAELTQSIVDEAVDGLVTYMR